MPYDPASYPPAPPIGTWRRSFWKARVRFESTIALSMLEPWERISVLLFSLLITALFWASVLTLYPRYISYLGRRFSYYVFDDETVSTRAVVKAWLKGVFARGLAGVGMGQGGETGLATTTAGAVAAVSDVKEL